MCESIKMCEMWKRECMNQRADDRNLWFFQKFDEMLDAKFDAYCDHGQQNRDRQQMCLGANDTKHMTKLIQAGTAY